MTRLLMVILLVVLEYSDYRHKFLYRNRRYLCFMQLLVSMLFANSRDMSNEIKSL
jgi:hypothetical protein